jgi:hypothetical protein
MKNLTPAERLFVAADPCSGITRGRQIHHALFLELAHKLKGTGVGILTGPILAAWGYGVIDEIRELRLRCWADLNLYGDQARLDRDGAFLSELRPDIVTVLCSSSIKAMAALKARLAGAEVFGTATLSGLSYDEAVSVYSCDPTSVMIGAARRAQSAGLDGCVVSPEHAPALSKTSMRESMNVMYVRPAWSLKAGENTARTVTPAVAMALGTNYMVVGEEIALAADPREAAMKTLEEIAISAAHFS